MPDGSIDMRVNTNKRLAMCQKPMGDFLPWIGNVEPENMILTKNTVTMQYSFFSKNLIYVTPP